MMGTWVDSCDSALRSATLTVRLLTFLISPYLSFCIYKSVMHQSIKYIHYLSIPDQIHQGQTYSFALIFTNKHSALESTRSSESRISPSTFHFRPSMASFKRP